MKGVFNPSVFVSAWLNRVGCNGRSVIAPEVISISEIHAQSHSGNDSLTVLRVDLFVKYPGGAIGKMYVHVNKCTP